MMGVIQAKVGRDFFMPVFVDDADQKMLEQWVWRVSPSGYAYRNTSIRRRGKKHPWNYRIWMHRQLMRLNHRHKRVVDHINCDKLDNRRENLQVVTQSKNISLAYQRRMVLVDARRRRSTSPVEQNKTISRRGGGRSLMTGCAAA